MSGGPRHLRTGAALGYASEVEDVRLRCACGHHQTEPLASDEPLRAQLVDVTCGRCGQVGVLHLAPAVSR